jgi:hypothetical protein
LHSHSWLYANSEKAVFTGRTLEGETRFAFVLDERGNFTTTHPLSSEAAFWVATTGEIERAVIACNPIEALSLWEHPDFENRRPAGKIKRIDQGKK